MKRALSIAFALAALASISRARAEGSAAASNPPENPDHPKPEEPKKKLSYWDQGNPRVFVSSKIDAGPNYAKVQAAVGYGIPHWIWIGFEAFPITTTDFGALYAGVRASIPFLDVAFGYRENQAYRRTYLPARDHHDLDEVHAFQDQSGPRARYLTWELEVSGIAPLFGGYAIVAVNADKILDGQPGMHVYEESARAIAALPWIIETRLGYVYPFGHDDFIKVGFLAEEVFLPGRPKNVIRVGPGGSITLTDHLELLGFVTVAVSSPDSLGFFLGAFGIGGLRYKWATGDPTPHFP